MHYKKLNIEDIINYRNDLYNAFLDNHLILDLQCELQFNNSVDFANYLLKYVLASDSLVIGIFDNKICYGYVIFDTIRIASDNSSAQVHIAVSKKLRGKKVIKIFKDIRDNSNIQTFYCEIPSIAIHAINICKKLGFKKTGYIPKIIPYKNIFGNVNMYDVYILTYQSDLNNIIKEKIKKVLAEICA